jgi:hypothetical protein
MKEIIMIQVCFVLLEKKKSNKTKKQTMKTIQSINDVVVNC